MAYYELLNPQGTWSSTVQYKKQNVVGQAALGLNYVSVPLVIYNGAAYYALTDVPVIGQNPATDTTDWQILSASASESPSFSGAVTAGTGITVTNGNLTLGHAGNKIMITEGANASSGTATLVAGTVTVANTSVTANSRFDLTPTNVNASTALGILVVTKNAGVGFTVTSHQPATPGSTQTGDLSSFDWSFIN